MPTWTIVHTRFWKMQIPYLARHYRVVTYDGPGNGRSARTTDPARYAAESYAADAAAVLDACGIDRAIVVGLSLGAQYGARLAADHPNRVNGLVLIGPALGLGFSLPERAAIQERLRQPYPDDPQGWDKYNVAYWHDHYQDFAEFFFEQAFPEPHSTKPIEDAVRWALHTGPDVLEAGTMRPKSATSDAEILERVNCPTLVIHGTEDRIQPHQTGVEAARLTRGSFVSMIGSGHIPNVRDPVRFNLLLREFVERVAA
jgi:pimeloyl-ACP methyl ester carboxylesterase